jgi:hypothetical protein
MSTVAASMSIIRIASVVVVLAVAAAAVAASQLI